MGPFFFSVIPGPSPPLWLITLHFFFYFSVLVLVRLFLRNEIILYYLVLSPHKDTLYQSVRPQLKQLLCSWVTAKTRETLLISGSCKVEMQTTNNIYFQTFQYKTWVFFSFHSRFLFIENTRISVFYPISIIRISIVCFWHCLM